MNFWVCVGLGVTLAILYKVYQNYKAKKTIKKLEQLNKINNDNVVIEDNNDKK